jgi:hypothetical protein
MSTLVDSIGHSRYAANRSRFDGNTVAARYSLTTNADSFRTTSESTNGVIASRQSSGTNSRRLTGRAGAGTAVDSLVTPAL